MTHSALASRLAVFACAGCVLPAAMSGCGDVPPLDDPDAGISVGERRSPIPRESAILELLREAGGPELARTEAFQDAAARMERAAPGETAAFLAAVGALQVSAPDELRWFLQLFLVATAADAEQDAMRTAFEALMAESEKAQERAKEAADKANAATAAIAEAYPSEAGMRTALEDAEQWGEAAEAAAEEALAAGVKAMIVALVLEGQADEALATYARRIATKAPSDYAAFLAAVEAAQAAAPDAWTEFLRVGALFVLAPTGAWR